MFRGLEQDQRLWKPEDIYEVRCPGCSRPLGFLEDEPTPKCHTCCRTVANLRPDRMKEVSWRDVKRIEWLRREMFPVTDRNGEHGADWAVELLFSSEQCSGLSPLSSHTVITKDSLYNAGEDEVAHQA